MNGLDADPAGEKLHVVLDSSYADGPDEYDVFVGVEELDDLAPFTTAAAIGPWFVVGGKFSGTSLVPDFLREITVQMPPAGAHPSEESGPPPVVAMVTREMHQTSAPQAQVEVAASTMGHSVLQPSTFTRTQ